MREQGFLRVGLQLFLFILSVIVIYLFFCSCLLLLHFPIYPDEIAIRVWMSRGVVDFPWHINIMPAADSFKSRLPVIWYFPSFIEWCLHGCINNLYTLRLVGVVSYLTMTVMLTFLLLNKTKKNVNTIIVGFGVVISCVSIGVLPVFFIMNRPEQILLNGLIILLFVYYYNYSKKNKDNKATLFSLICFYFAVSMMLYMHAKSLYLTPAYFLIAYIITSSSKKKSYNFFNFILLSLLILGNFVAWRKELLYDHLPNVKIYMDSFNINVSSLFTNMPVFFSQLKQSVTNNTALLSKLVYQQQTDIGYMPPLSTQSGVINIILQFNVLVISLYLFITLILNYIKDVQNKLYFSPRLLLLLIMFSIIGGNILNLSKTWYDVGYFWAIIMILFIAQFQESFTTKLNQATKLLILSYLIIIAIFSLIIFNKNYRVPLLTYFEGPGVNLTHFNYNQYRHEMQKISQYCLDNKKITHGIVLDDYTYLYFKNFRYPLLITYVNNHTNSNQFPSFVKAREVNAIIVRCSYISIVPNIKEKNILRFGDVCCYPGNKLDTL